MNTSNSWNLKPLSRAMRTIKIYTATSESLKSRMTPSVLSCRETERILSELALKLSDKKQIDYSIANQWLREKLSFILLRSAVLCVKVPKQPNFSWALILAGKQSQMWLESRHVLFVIFFRKAPCKIFFTLMGSGHLFTIDFYKWVCDNFYDALYILIFYWMMFFQ